MASAWPRSSADSAMRPNKLKTRIPLETAKNLLGIDRRIDLPALNEIVKIAENGLARDSKLGGQMSDVWLGLTPAQTFAQFILPGKPFRKAPLRIIVLDHLRPLQ